MSIKWLQSLIIAATVIFSTSEALAQTPLEARIRQILDVSSLDADRTGIAVVSVNKGNSLALINPDYPLNPASCAKILTSATALALFGSNYRFETSFFTDRRSQYGQIHNLYVVGSGDPSLVSEELWRIVSDLINQGVRSVSGDIIIDDSFFDGTWYPRKDLENDSRAFTASTSAFSLNFNSAKFVIRPGSHAGKRAEVTTDPPTSYIRIINKVATGGKFRAFVTPKDATDEGETFAVSGSIPPHAEPQFFYRVVSDPARFAGSVLKDMLIQNGVAVAGGVRRGQLPAGVTEISRFQSKPLSEIVRDMNKFSNNFIAEQLTKHMGAVKKGRPGSTAKGIEVIEDCLSSLGIPKGTYTLENGSGLSSVSRISASQLVKVLSSSYRSHKLQPDFIESLSILGIDGTMKSWRGEPNLHGWLRAKTGSLANVSCLSGYVPMQNGEVAAFAILANGFKRGKYSAHDAMLMIASAIAEGR